MRNCSHWAISSFVAIFSKSCLLQRRLKASLWGKGLTNSLIRYVLFLLGGTFLNSLLYAEALDSSAADNFRWHWKISRFEPNFSFWHNVFKNHLLQKCQKLYIKEIIEGKKITGCFEEITLAFVSKRTLSKAICIKKKCWYTINWYKRYKMAFFISVGSKKNCYFNSNVFILVINECCAKTS